MSKRVNGKSKKSATASTTCKPTVEDTEEGVIALWPDSMDLSSVLKGLVVDQCQSYTPAQLALKPFYNKLDVIGVIVTVVYYCCVGQYFASSTSTSLDVVVPPTWVAYLHYVATFFALFSLIQHNVAVPMPKQEEGYAWNAVQVFGRWVYLTRQTFALQAVHGVATLLSWTVYPSLEPIVHTMAAFVAGLGIFVTSQFYALIFFRRDFRLESQVWAKENVPFGIIMAVDHTPCAIIGVVDIAFIKNRTLLSLGPSVLQTLGFYFSFSVMYLGFITWNKHLTGYWPYSMLNALSGVSSWVAFIVGQMVVLTGFVSALWGIMLLTSPCW